MSGESSQLVPALLASLLREGVDADAVERAVARTADLLPGDSISGGDPLVRAFAFEQASLLRRGVMWGGS